MLAGATLLCYVKTVRLCIRFFTLCHVLPTMSYRIIGQPSTRSARSHSPSRPDQSIVILKNDHVLHAQRLYARRNHINTTIKTNVYPPLTITDHSSPEATLGNLYETAKTWLSRHNVPDSSVSARLILCQVARVGYRYSDFQRYTSMLLERDRIALANKLLMRRVSREPLQYILGDWDFYGLTLNCRAPILIPRPETEELVEHIVNSSKVWLTNQDNCNRGYDDSSLRSIHDQMGSSGFKILDIGAGTGAIGLAFLMQTPIDTSCTAIDINPAAVDLALENANTVLQGVSRDRYKCLQCDFLSFAENTITMVGANAETEMGNGLSYEQYDLIVSNPPYIPSAELETLQLEVRDFEDHTALDGGVDGLDIVRSIIRHAPKLLSKRGTRELWMELSTEHPKILIEWLQSKCALSGMDDTDRAQIKSIEALRDLSGKHRFVKITWY